MHVFDTVQDLEENAGRFTLLYLTLVHNVIKEIATGAVLHNQVVLAFGFNDLVQLRNMPVREFLQYGKLALYLVDYAAVSDLAFLDNFNSNFLPSLFVHGLLDYAMLALAQRLANDITSENFWIIFIAAVRPLHLDFIYLHIAS